MTPTTLCKAPAGLAGMGALICLAIWLSLSGCAQVDRRFPLREPMWRDGDLTPVSVACRLAPDAKDPQHVSCAPAVDPNPFIWDGVDNLFFRPLSESLGVVTTGAESTDVNSLDEVPDSAWFTNRIGVRPMSTKDLALGPCTPDLLLDGTHAPEGTWVVDQGKGEGLTEGFRVKIPGKGKYLFKADDAEAPEHASAAQLLGLRVYYAVGYYAPCEQIVYFKRSALKLLPGLRWKPRFQLAEPFGEKQLDRVLSHCARRGEFIRMAASAWIPGYDIGGAKYFGTRPDDPNDVVPHEDRRELRGKRLVDAWLDRTDDRRGNTFDAWESARPGAPDGSPGRVIHYALDTSEALGAVYTYDEIARRIGYSYIWDWGDIGRDFVTLGTRINVWDTDSKRPGKEGFTYFNVEDFVPDKWKNESPVAAFSRMTERDGAWAARILARFTPDLVHELALLADFSNTDDTKYLDQVLEGRLARTLERYLTRLSPITGAHVEDGSKLCGVDLAEWRRLRDPRAFRYTARLVGRGQVTVERRPGAVLCVDLPHIVPDGAAADDDPARYVRVRVDDGVARGPLIAHLYDLGPTRGYRLAGLERPER